MTKDINLIDIAFYLVARKAVSSSGSIENATYIFDPHVIVGGPDDPDNDSMMFYDSRGEAIAAAIRWVEKQFRDCIEPVFDLVVQAYNEV